MMNVDAMEAAMSNHEMNLPREDERECPVPPVAVSDETQSQILGDLTTGTISLMDATSRLGLSDAGWTLKLLADHGLALYGLDGERANSMAADDLNAFVACLRPEVRAMLVKRNRGLKPK